MKDWELIADRLSAAGWSWGCVSAIDSEGRTIWIVDAHRDDGRRFVVRADERLTAFVELERAIRDWWNPVKVLLTCRATPGRVVLAQSCLGVAPRELHLTLFPQG